MRCAKLTSAVVFFVTACAGGLPGALAASLYDSRATWLDDQAHAFSMQSLSGTRTVLTLAYGACRRVCASSLRLMQQAQALADERHMQLNFVVVGIDPAEDRPRDWAQYRIDRALTRPNWQFLTGTDAAVRDLARRLGVRYWRFGEHTMHDFRIVLLSADGQVVRAIDDAGQPPEGLLP